MHISMYAYRAPKAGRSISDCEDSVGYDDGTSCFAVADGASASARAAEWSCRLVRSFIETSPAERLDLAGWWPTAIDGFDPGETQDDSGWWNSEIARRGSYATFLGVQVSATATGPQWDAVAVGDSCLFHLRSDRLEAAFPLQSASAFDSTPNLVGSSRPPESIARAQGLLAAGDVLIAASDALAAWALWRSERDDSTWRFLTDLRSDNFTAFIEAARSSGELEDDDVSLLRCELLP